MRAAFTVSVASGALVTVAVHAGHDLRPEVAGLMALDDATRRREEDPFTDVFIGDVGIRCVAHRSRFEVDLNRPRERAVYVEPEDAWGLRVYQRPLPRGAWQASLAVHDEFYAMLAHHLDGLAASGRFLVLDVHSYNHRPQGPDGPPAPDAENPEVNVGTGSLDRARWGSLVRRFVDDLGDQQVAGHRLDVRENVRFRGGHLSGWVTERYPDTGCTLAIEFKKVFMDEWTGVPDPEHVAQLRKAFEVAARRTLDGLTEEPGMPRPDLETESVDR